MDMEAEKKKEKEREKCEKKGLNGKNEIIEERKRTQGNSLEEHVYTKCIVETAVLTYCIYKTPKLKLFLI